MDRLPPRGPETRCDLGPETRDYPRSPNLIVWAFKSRDPCPAVVGGSEPREAAGCDVERATGKGRETIPVPSHRTAALASWILVGVGWGEGPMSHL